MFTWGFVRVRSSERFVCMGFNFLVNKVAFLFFTRLRYPDRKPGFSLGPRHSESGSSKGLGCRRPPSSVPPLSCRGWCQRRVLLRTTLFSCTYPSMSS